MQEPCRDIDTQYQSSSQIVNLPFLDTSCSGLGASTGLFLLDDVRSSNVQPGLSVQALAVNPDIRVTFVGVTRRYQQCQEGVQAQSNAASAIQYRCLAPEHFVPAVRTLSGARLSGKALIYQGAAIAVQTGMVEESCLHLVVILRGRHQALSGVWEAVGLWAGSDP